MGEKRTIIQSPVDLLIWYHYLHETSDSNFEKLFCNSAGASATTPKSSSTSVELELLGGRSERENGPRPTCWIHECRFRVFTTLHAGDDVKRANRRWENGELDAESRVAQSEPRRAHAVPAVRLRTSRTPHIIHPPLSLPSGDNAGIYMYVCKSEYTIILSYKPGCISTR